MQKIIKSRNFVYLLLFATVLLSFYLKTLHLDTHMLFGFEQGRDMLVTQKILFEGDLVLLGPKTDLDGIFHGVWYYYILAAIAYLVSGDPVRTATVFCAITSVLPIVIYATCRTLGVRHRYALLGALIAALSYNHIIYARWLSNTSLSPLLSAIYFYFIIHFAKHKSPRVFVMLVALCGLFLHFELLNGLYAMVMLVVFASTTNSKFHLADI